MGGGAVPGIRCFESRAADTSRPSSNVVGSDDPPENSTRLSDGFCENPCESADARDRNRPGVATLYCSNMKSASQESIDARDGVQSSARLILDVARAASHLELAEVLESLIATLKLTINFHAVAVFVIEGEYARLHSLHVEGIERRAGEPVESVLARVAAPPNTPPPRESVKQRLSDHHVSAV